MAEWIPGQSGLVIDNRAALAGQPGLHAILVGVSDYEFLPNYDQPPDPTKLGFSKLSGPSLTVQALFNWLSAPATQLAQPLKTCRALTSPHREELRGLDRLRDVWAAKRQYVVQALHDWRRDACDHRDSVTLLYYCGHGMQVAGEDVVLTFADFLGPYVTKLGNCAEFSNIKLGMTPCPDLPEVARKQFYFVDACRNFPFELSNFENPLVPPVFDVPKNRTDDRQAPVLFGAPPTKMSIGFVNGVSVLGSALIHAVARAAEELDGPVGQERWKVDAVSLKRGIDRYIERNKLQQMVVPGGAPGQPALCWLDEPPPVEVECAIEPRDLHERILDNVALRSADPPPFERRAMYRPADALFAAEVPAGYYRVHVDVPGVAAIQSRVALVDQSLKLPWRVA